MIADELLDYYAEEYQELKPPVEFHEWLEIRIEQSEERRAVVC